MRCWSYHEATKGTRVLIPVHRRECQIINYDSRRTGNGFSDRGSTPL
nr:MAG TPA: hypothetical protein [Bacteriophage sp.]